MFFLDFDVLIFVVLTFPPLSPRLASLLGKLVTVCLCLFLGNDFNDDVPKIRSLDELKNLMVKSKAQTATIAMQES